MKQANHTLADLVDIDHLQRICDDMSATAGLGLAVLDPAGNVLVAAGWQDICTEFHRKNETTRAGCRESDLRITERLRQEQEMPEHIAYQCANGLWDVAFPLMVDGEHVGTAYTGQFFYDDDDMDVETFRWRAREVGFDEGRYLAALAEVPVVTHERVERWLSLLASFVEMLADIGLGVVRQEKVSHELHASEEKFKHVFDHTPVGMSLTLPSGVMRVNKALSEMLGYSPAELTALGWQEVTHPDDIAETQRQVDRLVSGAVKSTRFVKRYLRKGGSVVWADLSSSLRCDENGEPLYFMTVVLDITERRRAEAQVNEWHDLMEDIIRHDPTQIAVYDREQRYVFVSDRYLDDRRVVDRDVIGKHRSRVPAGDDEKWPEVLERALHGSVQRGEDDSMTRSDGSTMYCRWETRPWYLADGRIGGTISYAVDLTEQKLAEQALRQSEHLYQAFIGATSDLAFVKDEAFRYVIVNPANAAFFGRTVEEVIGRTDAELMPAEAAADCRASDEAALQTGGVVIAHERTDGRTYETRKFPVELANGCRGVGGYIRDVTEQRDAEEQVARLNTDLERRVAERTTRLDATNRELQSFAHSISHDLRAPLRALDGFSQILVEDYGERLDETGRGHLARIQGAARHMADLMDGLLQLSRLSREELQRQPVDLSELTAAIIEGLREQDPARRVDVAIAPHLTAIADPKLTRLVLENLVGNAWKFSARHETACIQFGAEPQDDDGVAFFVRDDGAGFEMRYADKLFGTFQRLHTPDQFEGTGIGLATVQRIVHRHGGKVWAEAAVEEGATFWFTLGSAAGA